MLKVELHCHTADDPLDYVPYSSRRLIDHAARLGYAAIAITLHDAWYDPAVDAAYARERGVTLIPGIERTIHGKHVLLLNFPAACERVTSFADLAAMRKAYPRGLVVAPHAFYPHHSAVGRRLLDEHARLFDAIEVNALFTRLVDFNAAAIAWAHRGGKPLVGNSDLHALDHLGTTYSLVDAEPTPDAICEAIREGRVEVHAEAVSTIHAGWTFGRMLLGGFIGRARRHLRERRGAPALR